jgi:hypothetical protein
MTVFSLMEEEWNELAVSKRSARRLHGWANTDDRLAGFADLEALRLYVHRRDQPAASDRVLAALAALAADDDLAARTVLQTLAPGLIRVACGYRGAGPSEDDVANTVVAAAFERIRTYPIERRPQRIAANVLFDTRQAVSRSLYRPRVREIATAETGAFASLGCEPSPTGELIALVDEATRRKKMTCDEARLILLTRVCDVSVTQIAREQGAVVQSLRRRRLRAESRLAAFAHSA